MAVPAGTIRASYTHGEHESVRRSHRWRTAENSAGYLLARLRPGNALLDVGCGPGTITAGLARAVAPGRVSAVDISPDAIAETGSTLGAGGSTELVVADAHQLPFPDGSFDVVHAHQVLQHVADPVGVLREMRRVCRPEGLVAVRDADYGAMVWYPDVPELHEWRALYQRIARSNGGEPDAGRRLVAWARAAGFGQLTPSAATWCFASTAERSFWGGMWADRIVDSAIAEQAVAEGHATSHDLRRISAGWRAWAGSPDGWLVVLHGELIAQS